MKVFYFIFVLSFLFYATFSHEDDFSEFHDPDDADHTVQIESVDNKQYDTDQSNSKDEVKAEQKPVIDGSDKVQSDDSNVETEPDESNYLQDSEEFEGFEKEGKKESSKPDLKIAKVPHHLTTSWENYYLEMLMIVGLFFYMCNFVMGKTRNNKLAASWFDSHKEMLEENFSLVGDDGSPTLKSGELTKESENLYILWCSGRVGFEGLLVELKLLKRQDLVSVVSRLIRPQYDQINVKVILDDNEMEGFVMCVANKKRVNGLLKEYQDLATFCPEKKSVKNILPESFALLTEIPEASTAVLDAKVQRIFKDMEDYIEYMHISDQYTGQTATQEDQSAKLPEIKKCILFGFKVGNKGTITAQQMENTRPLLQLVLYVVDKARRVRLSKEGRTRAERNRQKAAGSYERAVHMQRQEAAQQRRQERLRQEKERLMTEEDPERARKLEQSSQRREARSKQPRLKMLKIKG